MDKINSNLKPPDPYRFRMLAVSCASYACKCSCGNVPAASKLSICVFLADLVCWKKMVREQFVHGEHVHAVTLEHSLHLLIAQNLALVFGILEVSLFDVCPDFLDSLGS